jgi:HEAT repeat protein
MDLFGPNISKLEKNGDIEGLRQALQHEKSSSREKAALALDRLGWKPQDVIDKAWYFAGKRYLQELAELGEPAYRPLVLELKHSEEIMRRVAGEMLEKLTLSNPKRAVPFLCRALSDHSKAIYPPSINRARTRIVEILGKSGDPQALLPLIQSIDLVRDSEYEQQTRITPGKPPIQYPHTDAHSSVVQQAIRAMGETGIKALDRMVSSDETPVTLRLKALNILTTLGSPTDKSLGNLIASQIKNLTNGNNSARLNAIDTLDKINDSRVVEHLVNSLRDNYLPVRTAAAHYLRKRSWQPTNLEEKVYFLLADLLSSNTFDGYFSKEKWEKFSTVGEQAVNPLVCSLGLEGELTQHGYSVAFGIKVDASQYEAKHFIVTKLVEIGKPAIPALEKALDDPNPLIREGAQEALKKITKGRGRATRQTAPAPASGDATPKPTAGYVLVILGILLVVVALLLCVSSSVIVYVLSKGNEGNPGLVMIGATACILPLLLGGIAALVTGTIKLKRK